MEGFKKASKAARQEANINKGLVSHRKPNKAHAKKFKYQKPNIQKKNERNESCATNGYPMPLHKITSMMLCLYKREISSIKNKNVNSSFTQKCEAFYVRS